MAQQRSHTLDAQPDERTARCLSRVAARQPIVDVLSAAGAGAPNRCLGMVRGGRVAVGGRVVRDPRMAVDPFRERVTLDGRPLPLERACRYLLLFKPYGVLCAFTDRDGPDSADLPQETRSGPSGPHPVRGPTTPAAAAGDLQETLDVAGARPTLADYVAVPGVYAAGRLDLDSEGLVLLTDDGWLIHRLAHPRFHQPKTYLVQVEGLPGPEALRALRQGVPVKGRRTAPAQAELLPDEPPLPPRPVPIRYRASIPTAWLRLVLTEGRKRQVRHMTAAVGHPTLRLVRVAIGPLELGDLKPGEWRELAPEELEALRAAVHGAAR